MDELFASGVLTIDDRIDSARELDKLYGFPTDHEQLNRDKRKQKTITFVAVSIFLMFIFFATLPQVIDIIHTIASAFEKGNYFVALCIIFLLGGGIYFLAFHSSGERKPRKKDMVRISFIEEGISFVERNDTKLISWENVLQVRVLPSFVGIEVKDAERDGYWIIPNRFFEDRIMKDKIINYCNSNIKR